MALVALLLVGSIPTVALPPEPTGPDPVGGLIVSVEPLYDATAEQVVFAQQKANFVERTIRVDLKAVGAEATKVEFLFYVEGGPNGAPCNGVWTTPPATLPGMATTPPAAGQCIEGGGIVWVPVLSRANGWTASVNNKATSSANTPPSRSLTFVADEGTKLQQDRPQDFTVAFNVTGSPVAGSIFPIQVVAYTSPANPNDWVTTSASAPYVAGSCVDPNGVPFTYFCKSFHIQIDTTKPTVASGTGLSAAVITRDDDFDGRLDRFELAFSEPLRPDSLDFRRLNITTTQGTWPYSAYRITNMYFEPLNKAKVHVLVEEMPFYDTGASVKLLYDPCTDASKCPKIWYLPKATDRAGNELAAITGNQVSSTDGANPVVVGASAIETGQTLTVFFSEKVKPRDPGAASISVAHLTYMNSAAISPTIPEASPSNVASLTDFDNVLMTAPAQTDVDKITLTTRVNPNDNGNRLRFAAGDVHPFAGDAIGPGFGPNLGGEPTCAPIDRFAFKASGTGLCEDTRNALLVDGSGLRMFFPIGAFAQSFETPFVDENPPYFLPAPDATNPMTTYRRITTPMVARAYVDISHEILTIRFNNPVRSAATDGAVRLSDLDIKAATTDPFFGPGPGGVQSGLYNYLVQDRDTIVVTMDRNARPTDVDETPSFLKIHCNTIKGTGSGGVIPCGNPDQHSRTENPGGGAQPRITDDVAFLDRTPPRVILARTVDADHNGRLDGIELTFSEPVRDASFCGDPQFNQGPSFCGGSLSSCVSAGTPNCPVFRNPNAPIDAFVSTYAFQECQGPFRWETGSMVDDNKGIIAAVSATADANGLYSVRARDCTAEFFRTTPPGGSSLATDYLLHLSTEQPGLFEDRALNTAGDAGNRLVKYCHRPGTTVPVNCRDTLKVEDGAAPVVMQAFTYDAPTITDTGASIGETGRVFNTLTGRFDYPKHGNGFLNGYRLVLSEPVNDTTFNAASWRVAGYNVGGGFSTLGDTCPNGCDTAPGYRLSNLTLNPFLTNDREIVVRFSEIPPEPGSNSRGGDTDLRPELTYIGGAFKDCVKPRLSTHVKCVSGLSNSMVAFDTFAVIEQDDAAPQIVAIEGFPGDNQLTVHFSEPVDDGSRNKLARDDFQYGNGDGLPNSGMASGENVRHNPGDRIAYIGLNDPLTSSDVSQDTLQAVPGQIVEVAPSVALKKAVPNYKHKLNEARDWQPPSLIADVRVVAELTNGNSVTLAWTVPTDYEDDRNLVQGRILGYLIAANVTAIDATRFYNITNPEGVEIQLLPGPYAQAGGCTSGVGLYIPEEEPDPCVPGQHELAPAGAVQTARILGLKPDTTYHFAVVAFDMEGNPSPVSNDVVARTLRDLTPPTTCGANPKDTIGPIKNKNGLKDGDRTVQRNLSFNWTKACDADSTVVYRMALNQDTKYVVLQSDTLVLTNGTLAGPLEDGFYSLHVAAFSGGGQTRTASFNFTIGPQVMTPESIRLLNNQIKVTVRFEGGYNNVTWILPDKLPDGLEAVEIWRRDDGVPVKLATITGTSRDLGRGSFLDTTPGSSPDSEYRVNMVFATAQKQDDVTLLSDPFVTASGVSGPVPFWVWIVVGIALALLAAGIIIYVLLARKRVQVETGDVAYAWESADPNALPVDPATGLPVHPVKCPTCSTSFQAIGVTPLGITCPNCGTSGTLN